MKVFCTNAQCVITNPDMIASGSCNYFTADFIFNEAWDTLSKYVLFTNIETETAKEVLLTGNSCLIPPEVLLEQGNIYIGVVGIKNHITEGNQIVLTTNMAFACTLLQGPDINLLSKL